MTDDTFPVCCSKANKQKTFFTTSCQVEDAHEGTLLSRTHAAFVPTISVELRVID